MREALSRLEKHSCRALAGPDRELDETLLFWLAGHFAIFAEAAGGLSAGLREAHPGFPWRAIDGMRLYLAQDPFGIAPSPILNSLRKDLPLLEAMLRELERGQRESRSEN